MAKSKRILSNITVTFWDKSRTSTTTTMVATAKLYEGRTPEELKAADRWAKQVCDGIYGKQ